MSTSYGGWLLVRGVAFLVGNDVVKEVSLVCLFILSLVRATDIGVMLSVLRGIDEQAK